LNRTTNNPPLYRRVINREPTPDGEIITLDCGHRYEIITHKREKLPCEDCTSESSKSQQMKP